MAIRIYKQNLNYNILPFQSSVPAGSANTTTLYADGTGKLSWKNGVSALTRTFDGTGIDVATTWTLPAKTGVGTLTLAGLETAQTFTAAQTYSANGAASTPSVNITGTPYAGTTTNSYPLLMLNNTGTPAAAWNAGGTYFGIVGASGFGGNFIDIHPYNSTSIRFRVDSSGNTTIGGNIILNNTVASAVAIASTHKMTVSIGGTTYYVLLSNV